MQCPETQSGEHLPRMVLKYKQEYLPRRQKNNIFKMKESPKKLF